MKSRIPAAVTAGLLKSRRIALTITVFIAVAPQALALSAQSGQKIIVEESSTYTQEFKFNKDSISEAIAANGTENPVPDLLSLVKNKISTVLKEVSKKQNPSDTKLLDLYNDNAARSQKDFNVYAAAMHDDKIGNRPDTDSIRSKMGSDFQKVVSDDMAKSVKIFDQFKSGLNFNLDLGNSLSGAGDKDVVQHSGSVRYGLVVQDIVPGHDGAPQAALDSGVDQMQYAGHAEVHWTIAPVSESSPAHPFVFEDPSQESAEDSLFAGMHAPSTKIVGHVEPATQDLAPGSVPGAKFSLKQEAGLYEFSYVTKNGMEKDKSEHTFRIPMVREMAFGRRYSDSFQVLETSIYNILVNKDAPSLNVHYLSVEDQYKADLKFTQGNSDFGFTLETPSGWHTSDSLGKNDGEKYKIDYNLKF